MKVKHLIKKLYSLVIVISLLSMNCVSYASEITNTKEEKREVLEETETTETITEDSKEETTETIIEESEEETTETVIEEANEIETMTEETEEEETETLSEKTMKVEVDEEETETLLEEDTNEAEAVTELSVNISTELNYDEEKAAYISDGNEIHFTFSIDRNINKDGENVTDEINEDEQFTLFYELLSDEDAEALEQELSELDADDVEIKNVFYDELINEMTSIDATGGNTDLILSEESEGTLYYFMTDGENYKTTIASIKIVQKETNNIVDVEVPATFELLMICIGEKTALVYSDDIPIINKGEDNTTIKISKVIVELNNEALTDSNIECNLNLNIKNGDEVETISLDRGENIIDYTCDLASVNDELDEENVTDEELNGEEIVTNTILSIDGNIDTDTKIDWHEGDFKIQILFDFNQDETSTQEN